MQAKTSPKGRVVNFELERFVYAPNVESSEHENKQPPAGVTANPAMSILVSSTVFGESLYDAYMFI